MKAAKGTTGKPSMERVSDRYYPLPVFTYERITSKLEFFIRKHSFHKYAVSQFPLYYSLSPGFKGKNPYRNKFGCMAPELI